MRWVYILKCEDNHFYVGETKRLYTRFWEHINGNGSLNTSIYKPENIVAIYKVNVISNFIKYNNITIDDHVVYKNSALNIIKYWDKSDEQDEHFIAENYITECLMTHRSNEWTKIRGGKYTRFDIDYNFPLNEYLKDLPLCNCGLPCDIKKNETKEFLFFRCAKKNMWDNLKRRFSVNNEACSFYKEYTKDQNFRLQLNKEHKENKESFIKLLKKSSYWLKNVEIYDDKEGCIDCWETDNLLRMYDKKIRLCTNCFKYNHDELSQKYGLVGKCLINI